MKKLFILFFVATILILVRQVKADNTITAMQKNAIETTSIIKVDVISSKSVVVAEVLYMTPTATATSTVVIVTVQSIVLGNINWLILIASIIIIFLIIFFMLIKSNKPKQQVSKSSKGITYAIISDIHSNLDALQAVFEDIKNNSVDRVACCGDITGYGPQPAECLSLIRKKCRVIIQGNHDAAVSNTIDYTDFNEVAKSAVEINRKLLGSGVKYIKTLSEYVQENDIYFTHGSPRDHLNEYLITQKKLRENISLFKERVCFVGHSHLPLVFGIDNNGKEVIHHIEGKEFSITLDQNIRYIINVGSVGQPRDDEPKSCVVYFNTATLKLTYRRIEYDIKAVQSKIIKAGLPQSLATRLTNGE